MINPVVVEMDFFPITIINPAIKKVMHDTDLETIMSILENDPAVVALLYAAFFRFYDPIKMGYRSKLAQSEVHRAFNTY